MSYLSLEEMKKFNLGESTSEQRATFINSLRHHILNKEDDEDVATEILTKGIVLAVHDNHDKYRGKLKVGKGFVEWCKGRTRVGNGIKVN